LTKNNMDKAIPKTNMEKIM